MRATGKQCLVVAGIDLLLRFLATCLTCCAGGAGHGRPGAVKDAAQRAEQLALIQDRESKRSLGHLPTDHSMQRLEHDY